MNSPFQSSPLEWLYEHQLPLTLRSNVFTNSNALTVMLVILGKHPVTINHV